MSKYWIQKKGTSKLLRITGARPNRPIHPSNPGNPNRPRFKKGGSTNTRRENRLEELGRVDSEKAETPKGKTFLWLFPVIAVMVHKFVDSRRSEHFWYKRNTNIP